MNKVLAEDIQRFTETFTLKDELRDKHFLITGGTGLIGSILTKCLIFLNENIKVTLPVRNTEKAKAIYEDMVSRLDIVEAKDLIGWTQNVTKQYDFIIHCASPTTGKYMVEHPVETYNLAYQTTFNLLRLAKDTHVESFVYISSLEYYGQILDDRIITEDIQGYIDESTPRSSYPLAKRSAEYLCTSFATEYHVPTKIARLTQTFGAGVSKEDNRVFAQFARSIINNEDIVLHTKGESAKPYCYTTDCISAILYILLKGQNGEAYNVANDSTYISIKDMAEFLCITFNKHVSVRIEEHPEMGYAPVTKLNLSTDKLKSLGWSPHYNLKEMFQSLISTLSI